MNTEPNSVPSRPDVLQSFLLTEFVTLTHTGAPVAWPVLCEYEQGRIVVSTPYILPTKTNNARRNHRVAAFRPDSGADCRRLSLCAGAGVRRGLRR